MDPDPGGPKTYVFYASGSESEFATLTEPMYFVFFRPYPFPLSDRGNVWALPVISLLLTNTYRRCGLEKRSRGGIVSLLMGRSSLGSLKLVVLGEIKFN
jgi:hypothetical protein